MWRRTVIVAVLLSCSSKRHTDDKPSWKVSTSEINDERNAIAHGKHLGDALRAPRVIVDARLTINDSQVAERNDLRFAGQTRLVQSVFDWASGLKKHWLLLHGDDFDSAAEVTIADDVEFAEGASVVLTLARANFDSALTIRTKSVSTTIDLPQGGSSRAGDPRIVQLWLTTAGWTATRLVLAIEPPAVTGESARMAVFSDEVLPRISCARAITVTDAASICRGATCDVILIGGPRKFREAVEMLGKVAPTTKPYAGVSFLVDPPCDPK